MRRSIDKPINFAYSMADTTFSDEVLRVLTKAGWYPRRQVTPTQLAQIESDQKRRGTGIAEVVALLSEFGFLKLEFQNKNVEASNTHRVYEVSLDPMEALDYINESWLTIYSRFLGRNVEVLGWMEEGPCLIVMDSEGCIYLGCGNWLGLVGYTFAEVLQGFADCSAPLQEHYLE